MKFGALLLFCLTLVGCNVEQTVYGPRLTEPGKVLNVVFSPGHHSTSTDVGFTSNGDVAFTPHTVSIPDQYGVIFECQHGKFVVSGAESKDKKLFDKLSPGQHVIISYREKWTTWSAEPGRRQFDGYDFIDAEPDPAYDSPVRTLPAEAPPINNLLR